MCIPALDLWAHSVKEPLDIEGKRSIGVLGDNGSICHLVIKEAQGVHSPGVSNTTGDIPC